MNDPVKTLQTVPVAVGVSILLAGIMWYASAVHTSGLASSNPYFIPSTADCGPTRMAETEGYMAHWMDPDPS